MQLYGALISTVNDSRRRMSHVGNRVYVGIHYSPNRYDDWTRPAQTRPVPDFSEITKAEKSPWWAHQDLNLEPTEYESAALTVELWAPRVCYELDASCSRASPLALCTFFAPFTSDATSNLRIAFDTSSVLTM